MKNIYTTTIAIAFSVLAAGQVMAAGAGDTIEPITGMTLREINPAYYGGATAQSVKTRAEVRAELMKAQSARNAGDTVEPITGMTLREINPAYYGGATAQSVKTRTEVRAELMKAQSARNAGDTVEPITGMTLREINPARYAKSAN